jgi:tryptophan-rich sensory protein
MPYEREETVSTGRQVIGFVLAVLVPEVVGAVSGIATQSSVSTWYPTLEKPWFTPPDAVFAPVWITLYAMMGVASWLVWREGPRRATTQIALAVYAVHLVLNAAWSLVFFGLRAPGGGLVVIVVLVGAVIATMRRFARVRALAAWLLAPYLVWVLYATALNATIWWMN